MGIEPSKKSGRQISVDTAAIFERVLHAGTKPVCNKAVPDES